MDANATAAAASSGSLKASRARRSSSLLFGDFCWEGFWHCRSVWVHDDNDVNRLRSVRSHQGSISCCCGYRRLGEGNERKVSLLRRSTMYSVSPVMVNRQVYDGCCEMAPHAEG